MKLTAKKAVELSIKLWTWLAETGEEKGDWPEWKENGGKYLSIEDNCFLCRYNTQRTKQSTQDTCSFCPYSRKYGHCNRRGGGEDKPFRDWYYYSNDAKDRKRYAKQFLEQLKAILQDMEAK